MITALILIYTALIFALGVIIGGLNKKGEEILEKQKPEYEPNSEICKCIFFHTFQQLH